MYISKCIFISFYEPSPSPAHVTQRKRKALLNNQLLLKVGAVAFQLEHRTSTSKNFFKNFDGCARPHELLLETNLLVDQIEETQWAVAFELVDMVRLVHALLQHRPI